MTNLITNSNLNIISMNSFSRNKSKTDLDEIDRLNHVREETEWEQCSLNRGIGRLVKTRNLIERNRLKTLRSQLDKQLEWELKRLTIERREFADVLENLNKRHKKIDRKNVRTKMNQNVLKIPNLYNNNNNNHNLTNVINDSKKNLIDSSNKLSTTYPNELNLYKQFNDQNNDDNDIAKNGLIYKSALTTPCAISYVTSTPDLTNNYLINQSDIPIIQIESTIDDQSSKLINNNNNRENDYNVNNNDSMNSYGSKLFNRYKINLSAPSIPSKSSDSSSVVSSESSSSNMQIKCRKSWSGISRKRRNKFY